MGSKIACDFGWVVGGSWGRFLTDLGPKLGAKLGPSWHQNRKKGVPKRCQKIIKNLEPQGSAGGTQVNLVQAPKESLRDPLILQYKSTRGKLSALGTLPSRAQGPGADIYRVKTLAAEHRWHPLLRSVARSADGSMIFVYFREPSSVNKYIQKYFQINGKCIKPKSKKFQNRCMAPS